MINTLYLPELREMIVTQNLNEILAFCEALHPARTAEFMEGLTSHESWQVLRHADPSVRHEIFSFFSEDKQVAITEDEDRNEIAELYAELSPDDRVDILQSVSSTAVEELLDLLPADERRDVLRLQSFPEQTAGAVMTTDFAKVSETMTVRQALDDLSQQSTELETIYYIYVLDEGSQLRGVVSARDLVSAIGKPETEVGELMETDVVVARSMDDQEDVAQKVARYDLLAIPVVDEERRMLGIITHDDIIDVMREEATEDAHLISAVAPLEESYLKTSVLTLCWKRGIWLTVLFFAALLTALVLGHYEDGIRDATWLVLFIPLVISSGGNSGSQSATLIITGLATDDIDVRNWLVVVRRELMMGLILGGFLALIGMAAAFCMAPPTRWHAFVIPITLLLVVITGTLSGAILPILFQRLGLDPAMMSNPFVAGIVDIVGIAIYMNIALALIP